MKQKQYVKPKTDLYFIAIVADGNFGEEVTKIKQHFADNFNSRHALRSPPHITLHMPFKWRFDKIEKLLNLLADFVEDKISFEVVLDGFGSFSPRVIFIEVKQSKSLEQLHKELCDVARIRLKLVNSNYKNKAFHPHVTVAFRDLSKKNFHSAWEEYHDKKIYHRLTADQITLLKHNGRSWDVYKTFEFGDRID